MELPLWLRPYTKHLWIVLLSLLITIALRSTLIDFSSSDFTVFLRPWINYINDNGMKAYGIGFSNYSPFYTYFLGLGTFFFPNISSLYLVKSITFVGEGFAAFWVYRLLSLHCAPHKYSLMPISGAMLLLLCPTIITNGTASGQCDAWYAAFLLAAIYYILERRPIIGMIYAGLAFSFKLQAIFLAPLLLVFVLRKRVPWQSLAIIPAIYIILCVPCWLEGRSWPDLLTIYWGKFARERVNSDAANFYLYLGKYDREYIIKMGLLLSVEVAALLTYITWKRWKAEPDVFTTVLLATLCGGIMPFILPTMHDRYFFLADIFSLILVMMRPRWFMLPVLFQCATIMATPQKRQLPHLHGVMGWIQGMGISEGIWFNAIAITCVVYLCWKYIWKLPAVRPAPDIVYYPLYENKTLVKDNETLLTIIVPCFNESDNIASFYKRIRAALGDSFKHALQILFIDDGSTDDSWQQIQGLSVNDIAVKGIRLSRNFGHQMALMCGLEHAKGERILVIDADLQDPPELLPEMLRKMDEGYDVIYGKRLSREGETYFKKISAWAFYRVFKRLSEVDVPLDAGDFRLMTLAVVRALCDLPERVRYTRGLISWLGFSQTPIEYTRHPRNSGETHYSLRKMLRLAGDGITSFSSGPLQLATWVGVIMMCLSTILLGYVFISWMFFNTVAGWTSLAAIFLLSQAFQWLVLGIIGNYVAVIFKETKARPHFIVREHTRT